MTRQPPGFTQIPAIAKPFLMTAPVSVHRVYTCLLSHADNGTGIAILKKRTIEAEIGMCRRSVMAATAQLVAWGLVRKFHRGPYAQAYQLTRGELFQPDPVLMMAIPPPSSTGAEEGQKRGKRGAKEGQWAAPKRGSGLPPQRTRLLELDNNNKLGTEGHQRAREARAVVVDDGGSKTTAAGEPAWQVAWASLREAVAVRGLLPEGPEMGERILAWYAAGWTAETLSRYLSDCLRRTAVRSPRAFVRTILRGEPERPSTGGGGDGWSTPVPAQDEPECVTCGRVERACRQAAAKGHDPHPFKAKGATKGNGVGVEILPPTGPQMPLDGSVRRSDALIDLSGGTEPETAGKGLETVLDALAAG